MDKLKSTLFSALLSVLLLTPAAFAQATAAKIEVVYGNGQLLCSNCPKLSLFYPMVVKVTDASGQPISGKTVNWDLANLPGAAPTFDRTSVTDATGTAYSRLQAPIFQYGTVSSPTNASVIRASVDNHSVDFFETVGLTDTIGLRLVSTSLLFPDPSDLGGTPLVGPAGGTGTTPIRVHVEAGKIPIPNISVRIQSPDPVNLPSASCVTGAGADPGSVLTNANGDAICTPVFGPKPTQSDNGRVNILIGGLNPLDYNYANTSQPLDAAISYAEYDFIQLRVSPVTPGRISVVNGNNQSINPGQTSAPLVVAVSDATGAVSIAGQSVNWTVSPAGAATLSSAATTTNAQGQAQTTITLAPNAVGQVTVTAALPSPNNSISTTFTVNTNVQISSMTKVSGDLQSIQAGQDFPNALVVQLTATNGQPVVGQPVSFVVASGSATLSGSSRNTDGNGRAQVTVKAGATPGTVTVSAAVGNVSQTFTLTVIPPGPALTNTSFYNVGGHTRVDALAPCTLVTVVASGLAPNIQGSVLNSSSFGPWAINVASNTITINNTFAPVSSVSNIGGVEQMTFQVPCEVAPAASVPVTINVGGGAASVNMPVRAAAPAILETVMSDNVRRAVAVRPDGSFVSLQNPARRSEMVRVFVTGLGVSSPAVGTGSLPVPGNDALAQGTVIVGVNNAGAGPATTRVSPNLIGTFEVAFRVPDNAPTGNDIVLSVAVNAPGDDQTRFSNSGSGSKLPIQ